MLHGDRQPSVTQSALRTDATTASFETLNRTPRPTVVEKENDYEKEIVEIKYVLRIIVANIAIIIRNTILLSSGLNAMIEAVKNTACTRFSTIAKKLRYRSNVLPPRFRQ